MDNVQAEHSRLTMPDAAAVRAMIAEVNKNHIDGIIVYQQVDEEIQVVPKRLIEARTQGFSNCFFSSAARFLAYRLVDSATDYNVSGARQRYADMLGLSTRSLGTLSNPPHLTLPMAKEIVLKLANQFSQGDTALAEELSRALAKPITMELEKFRNSHGFNNGRAIAGSVAPAYTAEGPSAGKARRVRSGQSPTTDGADGKRAFAAALDAACKQMGNTLEELTEALTIGAGDADKKQISEWIQGRGSLTADILKRIITICETWNQANNDQPQIDVVDLIDKAAKVIAPSRGNSR